MNAMLPFDGKDGITGVMVQAFGLIRKVTKTAEVRPRDVLPESLSRPQFRYPPRGDSHGPVCKLHQGVTGHQQTEVHKAGGLR